MKKYILTCINLLIITHYGFCINHIKKFPSLNSLASQKIFQFKDEKAKLELNQKLINNRIFATTLCFDGVTLKNLDLSEMHLREINFSGCTFINVKFINADLTDTQFDRAKFDKDTDLSGAIIYDPVDKAQNPIMELPFRINNSKDHLALVNQYSNLMIKGMVSQSNKDKVLLLEQSRNLNKFLGPLGLDLNNKQLTGLYLLGINLSNVNLYSAQLQKAFLKNAILQNANLCQAQLQEANLQNADLQYTTLSLAELQNANLQGAQLQYANLYGAKLQGAKLQNTQLQDANLSEAHLQNSWLSDNVHVPDYPEKDRSQLLERWSNGSPEEQECYQKLFNTGFNLTLGTDPTILIETLEIKVNKEIPLNNAQLNNAELIGINLQGAQLKNAQLQGAKLSTSQLQNSQLQNSNLSQAELQYAQLQNSNLSQALLQDADLQCADLQGTNLCKANLQRTKLQHAQLQNSNLAQALLQNAQLNNANLENSNLQGANLENTTISGAKLSQSFFLPPNCIDENLMDIYEKCTDKQAKNLLKDILIAKKIIQK